METGSSVRRLLWIMMQDIYRYFKDGEHDINKIDLVYSPNFDALEAVQFRARFSERELTYQLVFDGTMTELKAIASDWDDMYQTVIRGFEEQLTSKEDATIGAVYTAPKEPTVIPDRSKRIYNLKKEGK